MRHLVYLAAAFTVGAALLAPVAAQADTAADFNMFVIHNATIQGSDTEGRVAIGGNADLSNYSVGATLPDSAKNNVNFVVGGDLTTYHGSVKGLTYVGGAIGTVDNGVTFSSSPNPVDFTSEATRLYAVSDILAGYATTSGATLSDVNWGGPHGEQMTLTATGAGLNVFNLDGALLSQTNTLNIVVPAGATILINVDGVSASIGNLGIKVNGVSVNGQSGQAGGTDLLWNFSEATSLNLYNIGWAGSILAPNAAFSGSGAMDGQLIVDSITGSWSAGNMQVNSDFFSGGLLSIVPPPQQGPPPPPPPPNIGIPEPATWGLMILGFGLAGAALRRRRAVPRYA